MSMATRRRFAARGLPAVLCSALARPRKAGIKLLHVPYKRGAGASTIATLSGEVAATMVTTASLVPHAKTGKIKVLAVVSKTRVPALQRDCPLQGRPPDAIVV